MRRREPEALKTITIRLPERLIKAAKIAAVERGITLQELVRESLTNRPQKEKRK